jgi:hypothetical protein
VHTWRKLRQIKIPIIILKIFLSSRGIYTRTIWILKIRDLFQLSHQWFMNICIISITRSLVFMCMFCRSLLVLFLLAIVLSVLLQYTDSDCPFGIILIKYTIDNIICMIKYEWYVNNYYQVVLKIHNSNEKKWFVMPFLQWSTHTHFCLLSRHVLMVSHKLLLFLVDKWSNWLISKGDLRLYCLVIWLNSCRQGLTVKYEHIIRERKG